jgi:hypothetical protein
MAITIHTTASDVARVTVTNVSSNTTIGINKPTNVANGDLMILKVSSNDTLNPSSISLSDWTLINDNFSVNGANACHTAYYWRIWLTGDATSWTATIGASTLDDESFVFRVTGYNPSTPIDVAATSQTSTQSNGPVCPSITTVTDGAVAIYGVSAKNGSVLTGEDTGQPTSTTLIHNKRSRNASGGVNSALAYELRATAGATGTRTWTLYTSSAQYHSAYSFAIRPGSVASIDSVNGGAGITAGSTGNIAVISGYDSPPTSGTFGGVSLTSFTADSDSAEFSMPGYVDGGVYPDPESNQNLVIGSDTVSVALNLPSGMDAVTISSAVDDDDTYIGYHTALSDGFKIVFPTESGNFSVSADGKVTATAGTRECWKWNSSTGVMSLLNVTVNDAGMTVTIGLTASALTASSLTSSGLTAAGL